MGICLHRAKGQDTCPSTICHHHVNDYEGGDSSCKSWFSEASTSLTTWISQPSSSFTAIWGNNNNITHSSAAIVGRDETFARGPIITNSNLRVFTFAQMNAATYNFRRDVVLGKGGFGKVCKGWIKENLPPGGIKKTPVAIKKLDSSSMQGFREWKAEVDFLGQHSHPNLLKLLGYCCEDNEFLLVYEFMQKGTLSFHLFGKRSVQPLPWDIRLKIAIGTARGLAYLHTLENPIIYRDLKSSNILLDESYNVKIADFGLSFLGPLTDNSHTSTSITGTLGYIDPQYFATGHLYVKSDVYGFGVVLVEMLTGLQAIDRKRPTAQQILVEWIKPCLSSRRKLKNAMDPRLGGKYPSKEASQIAQLALKCLRPEPQLRPSMTEIVETLEQVGGGNAYNTTGGGHAFHS